MFQGQGFACASNRADRLDCYVTLPIGDNLRKSGYLPPLASQTVSYSVKATNGVFEINGQSFTAADMQAESSISQNDAAGATLKVLAYPDGVSYQPSWWVGKLYSFSAKLQSGEVRFIPALRTSDSVAGMWDTVSKQFFTNAGTGTFGYRIKTTGEVVAPAAYSLRDPHRVAPSGVWARLSPDGALDAVAETELDAEPAEAQGYAYFANTADAAEVLGATEQELV